MGKLVTVKTGYTAVLLPNKSGDGSMRNYSPGDTVTVTDAEYAAFNAATLGAITLTTSGLPDPARKSNDPSAAADNVSATVSGTATAVVGWNEWTLTGSVTTLNLQAADLTTTPVKAGASPGSASLIAFKLTQGGAGSFTVAWGSRFKFVGGSAPTLSTVAGKVDILRFITFDGGTTAYEISRTLDVR